jgi:HK97 family phage major capsid protein
MRFAVNIERHDDVASLTPAQVRSAIAERSDALHTIFEEAGPDLDASRVAVVTVSNGAELAQKVRALNDEMTWLGERATELDELDAVRANAERWRSHSQGHNTDPAPFAPRSEQRVERPRSLGSLFVESAVYQAARNRQPNVSATMGVEVDNFLRPQAAVFQTGAGWAPESTRTGRVVLSAEREIQVIDAFPIIPTSQAAIVYMEETTFTNAAAERNENAAYAEAALELTERSETVRSVGVSLPVTDEQMADEAGAAAYVDQRLGFMVRQRLDGQLLVGNGNAPNLRGTLHVGSINTQAKGADPVFDAIYKGARKVRVTGRSIPSAIMMHPEDWEAARLTRTADGIYILGNPMEAGPERMWSLPVVQTDVLTKGTALVGDWARMAAYHARQGVDIQTGFVGDDFKEGRVTLRAGLRGAVVHYRPSAFTQVTGL